MKKTTTTKTTTTKLGGEDTEKLDLLHTENADVRCYNHSGN